MRPRGVVVGDSGADELSSLIEIDEQALIEKLVAHPAVETLTDTVLLRLPGRDEMADDRIVSCPAKAAPSLMGIIATLHK